jgi:hypothetical protein
MRDITVSSTPSFPSIGFILSTPFTGTFEGNGKKITGLEISGNNTVGLFYSITSGRVENLGLIGVSITAIMSSAGGIAGSNSGTVRNCYATGTVSGTGAASQYIGGVVGRISVNTSLVQNCYATGNVSGDNAIGGIVGHRDAGNVEYCVALNSNITCAGTDYGRVVGATGTTVNNNYGRNDMKKDNAPMSWTPGFITTGMENGADISPANWNNAGWWTDTAQFASAVWDITANKLPTLKDIPSGTQNPAP